MSMSTVYGDFYFPGSVILAAPNIPSGVITNASIAAAAGINASKLEQQPAKHVVLSNHATSVSAMRLPLHKVRGATGTILKVGVSATVAATGGDSATFDFYVNGSSILSGTFNLDSGDAAYALVEGVISDDDLTVGDQIDVVCTAVSGTAPKGVAAWLWVNEDAQ